MPRATGRRTLGAAAVLFALAGAGTATVTATTVPRAAMAAIASPMAAARTRTPGRGRPAARPRLLAVGTVVEVTTIGGLLRHGVLQLQRADGRIARISLSPRTRVLQFRGQGVPVARISVTALVPGDVVVVRGWVIPGRGPVALVIFDTSFNGAVNPAAAGPARPLTVARR